MHIAQQGLDTGTGHPKVWLENVRKQYGPVAALQTSDLKVRAGEFLTILGPSGSGKSTVLNLIAGMTNPTEGKVWIDGRDCTHVPPSKRGLGMVFQNYALMPHMSVFENVAFPLRVRKTPEADIKRRVGEALELVRLPGVANRKPAELSGGQQQRISIARCLVYNPAIILMDEPLGALDKKLREEMQLELKRLHVELNVTALYVTHDQEEALTMSDRIVLFNGGRIEQAGTPHELYFHPKTLFSAKFLGDSNVLSGRLKGAARDGFVETPVGILRSLSGNERVADGASVHVMVRPENVMLLAPEDRRDHANSVEATIVDTISFGGVIKTFARLADGSTMIVQELTRARRQAFERGARMRLTWQAEDMLLLPAA
jgi:putative spermidine/putrescine transport system ATP-binding protein